jgi:hypothetical protein
MGELIVRSVAALKQVVDDMPAFHRDGLRKAASVIDAIEHESDDAFAQSIRIIFPDPNQPVTAGDAGLEGRISPARTDYRPWRPCDEHHRFHRPAGRALEACETALSCSGALPLSS